MIQLNDIHLQLGTKVLLNDASLRIFPKKKLGIIGSNGSGKTSLFKLILNEYKEDAGTIDIPSEWRISHMAQEVGASQRSALNYVLDGDKVFRNIEAEIETLTQKSLDDSHTAGTALGAAYAKMENIDGYTAVARAQRLLDGLGFAKKDDERSVQDFSGGWRIRLNLARALMSPSDLLLLDEPTNHLDLDATLWLEEWLKTYPGTLLIISHDRDFLDNIVDGIINIHNEKLESYSGNYSAYELQKAERLSQQASAFAKQQERISEIENFVRRFKAKASKAKQAQSRVKELERMEKIAPAHIDSPFSFRFGVPERVPQTLINLNQATIGYIFDKENKNNDTHEHENKNEKVLASAIELSILASTRIGLLGHNGAGKSTLIKTLSEEIPLLRGEKVDSVHLRVGYFAQHQLEALDLSASCALHLQRLDEKASEQAIRTFLGSFGFQGDRAFECIKHFSGGEKARLALAIVTWQKPNLLILDEPTNHLDLEMRHALTMALQEFEGAIILVSHDRHLLRNTVDDFLLVDSGKITKFDGTLTDYQKWLVDNKIDNAPKESNLNSENPLKRDKKVDRQSAAEMRQKLKPLTNEIQKLEKSIETTSKKLEKLEKQLADPKLYEDQNDSTENQKNQKELQKLIKQQGELNKQQESEEELWLEKSEALEELKTQS